MDIASFLSSIPRCRKAVHYRANCVSGKPHSCASYSALGTKFNVKDSTVHGKGDLNINARKMQF